MKSPDKTNLIRIMLSKHHASRNGHGGKGDAVGMDMRYKNVLSHQNYSPATPEKHFFSYKINRM
jgi:hypothetical protein